MSFTLHVVDLALDNASPGINYQDKSYSYSFKVKSTAASNVVAVDQWLIGQLPWTLVSYGAPYANLESFSVKALEDPNSPLIFSGVARYGQTGTETAAKIRFGNSKYTRTVFKALDENDKEVSVLNSAGNHFGTPLEEEEDRLVIIIDKTYVAASASPGLILSYKNTVNLNPITIADTPIQARGGLMLSINPVIRIRSGSTYDWRVTFEIEVKGVFGGTVSTYDREILDVGYYYLVPVTATEADFDAMVIRNGDRYRKVSITTQNPDTGALELVTEPALLDGAGGLLQDITPGNEKYLKYQTKTKIDWYSLNLPRTIWETV